MVYFKLFIKCAVVVTFLGTTIGFSLVIAVAPSLDEILKHWIWLEEELLPILGEMFEMFVFILHVQLTHKVLNKSMH